MKKLSVPVITGLVLVGIDLLFWINWAYTCLAGKPICGEGLLAAYGLHLPLSWLGITVMDFFGLPYVHFFGFDLLELIVLFVFGVLNSFLIGYVLGWLGKGVYQFAKKHLELV